MDCQQVGALEGGPGPKVKNRETPLFKKEGSQTPSSSSSAGGACLAFAFHDRDHAGSWHPLLVIDTPAAEEVHAGKRAAVRAPTPVNSDNEPRPCRSTTPQPRMSCVPSVIPDVVARRDRGTRSRIGFCVRRAMARVRFRARPEDDDGFHPVSGSAARSSVDKKMTVTRDEPSRQANTNTPGRSRRHTSQTEHYDHRRWDTHLRPLLRRGAFPPLLR